MMNTKERENLIEWISLIEDQSHKDLSSLTDDQLDRTFKLALLKINDEMILFHN